MRGSTARWSLAAVLMTACGRDEQPQLLPPQADGGGCVPECTGQSMHGDDDESGGDDDFVCGEKTVAAQVGTARLLLVLDRSGSMGSTWDHDADASTPDVSRWAVLHEVVSDVVGTFDEAIELGLALFPAADDTCAVASEPLVAVGPAAGDEILAALPGPDQAPIMGDTPTVSALARGVDHLLSLTGEGTRAMLLVTDGEPTCGQTLAQAIVVVGDAFEEHGIVTYGVGLAVPEGAIEGFSELAEAGGAPAGGSQAFYDASTETQLLDALESVAEGLQLCAVALDPEPELPDDLELYLEGELLAHVDDCATQDGWAYADPDGPYDRLFLCGSACETAQASDGELVADYACPPVTPGP